MSELSTEQQAENTLFAAINAPDEPVPELELNQAEDIDGIPPPEDEPEGEQEAVQSKAAPQQEEPGDDFVEIPGANEGDEPTKVALKEVLEGYQAHKQLEGDRVQILERVEREAVEQTTGVFRQVEHFAKQTAAQVQAALQMIRPPTPPSVDLLNPSSLNYNPDQYHLQYAQFQSAQQMHNQAQGAAKDLLDQAKRAADAVTEQRETVELQRLNRVWPEFGQGETMNKFVSDMGKAYGYSPAELDASLNDHRNALVARDALAYRAMKAQSGDVKAKVEAKAPKLVRTKTEAKAGSAQARDPKGQFQAGTLQRALKSRSDDDWANHFAALSKAGRF